MKQAFEEQIGTKPIVAPCLVQAPGTQEETSATGLPVCLTVQGSEEAAHFYTGGVLYQLDFAGRTTLTTLQQKAYLVWLADQLH